MPQVIDPSQRNGGCRKPVLILMAVVLVVFLLIFRGMVSLFSLMFHHQPTYAFNLAGDWTMQPAENETLSMQLTLDKEGRLHGTVKPCRAASSLGSATDGTLVVFTDRSSWNGQDLHIEAQNPPQQIAIDAGVQGSRLSGQYQWIGAGAPVAHSGLFTPGIRSCGVGHLLDFKP